MEGPWCRKQISIVEKRRFQPTFSCGIPQPVLAHADFKYVGFRAMDPASKSRLELQPRNGSYVDIKFVHIGNTDASGLSSKASNWCHGGVEEFQFVSHGRQCYSSFIPYYKVLRQYHAMLQSTTPVLLRTTKYFSVLQSTTPVIFCTAKHYASTTPYYKVLPVLLYTGSLPQKLRRHTIRSGHKSLVQTAHSTKYRASTTPYYKVPLRYYPVLPSTSNSKYYSSTTLY